MISNQISEKLDKAASDYNIAGLGMTRCHPRESRKVCPKVKLHGLILPVPNSK